ncbi:hypothetical protein NMY22_g13366 [Coprinellus aureogranulatus]|nr:hypothetical protein NMY22_g13366 [Coprinellus aureogranulatus]
MGERRKAQQDLEARITEFELELCELKRKRNALLPIFQLPPELLCGIVSFDALTFANDDFAPPPANPVPKTLDFCHVSHLWRSIILGSPKMWSYIRVANRSPPGFLHFSWKNTGAALVDMNVDSSKDEYGSWGTPRAIDAVVDLIRQYPSKFRSLRVRLDLDSVQAIFEEFEGSFDNLEDLLISDPKGSWGCPSSSGIGQTMICKTPRLRRLWVTGYTLPFACPLVSSSHLEEARLFQYGGSLDDLLSFFRRCRNSSILSIEAGVNFEPSPGATIVSPFNRQNPLEMLQLKKFHIDSTNWRALIQLLHTIRFSSSAWSFSCGKIPDENLHEFFSAVAHAHGSILSPKEVVVGSDKVVAFWQEPITYPMVGGVRRMLPASINTQLVYDQGKTYFRIEGKIPFRNPLHYQTGWSFSKLRVLSVAGQRVPRDMWIAVAYSAPLEVLRVGPSVDCYDVFEALCGYGITAAPMPFPRLQVLVYTDGVPWNYDDAGRRSAARFLYPDFRGGLFYSDVAVALMERQQDREQSAHVQLALIDFRGFPEGRLGKEMLEVLRTVAKEVFWDARSWWTEGLDYEAS